MCLRWKAPLRPSIVKPDNTNLRRMARLLREKTVTPKPGFSFLTIVFETRSKSDEFKLSDARGRPGAAWRQRHTNP